MTESGPQRSAPPAVADTPLERVNAALRIGLERLAGELEPRAILRQVIFAMVSSLDAEGGALFEYSPADGRLVMTETVNPAWPPERRPERELALFAAPADVTPYWGMLRTTGRPVVLDAEDPAQSHLFWPGTREWHLKHRQPLAVGIALELGGDPLGMAGFTLARRVPDLDDRLALLTTLAHQATLALHLTRVHDQARRTAIERERRDAESTRAADRQRLANDIHDTLTQHLSAVVQLLQGAERRVHGAVELPELARAVQLSRAALADARGAIRLLRVDEASDSDPALDRETLVDRVRSITTDIALVEVVVLGAPTALPIGVAVELSRIVQAAVTNSRDHARARRIEVRLDFTPGPRGVAVLVRDDGVGFDPTLPRQDRYGLVGMRERAQRIGADIEISSAPGAGALVRVFWPRGTRAR